MVIFTRAKPLSETLNKKLFIFLQIVIFTIFAIFTFFMAMACTYKPMIALLFPACIFFCWLTLTKPEYAFLLSIAFIPFDRLTSLSIFLGGSKGQGFLFWITLPKLMLGSFILINLFRGMIQRRPLFLRELTYTPIPGVMAIFLTACWLSLTKATSPFSSFTALISLISCVSLAALTIIFIKNLQNMFRLLTTLMYSFLVYGLIGVYEAITKIHVAKMLGISMVEGPLVREETFRIVGAAGSPDFFAQSLLIGLSITVANLFRTGKWRTILALISIGILLFDILATGCRGVLLGLMVGIVVLILIFQFRYKWLIIGLLGAIASFILLVGSTVIAPQTLNRITGQTSTASIVSRMGIWNQAIEIIQDHPLLGSGLHMFSKIQHFYFDPRVGFETWMCHNTHLQVAAEIGLPSLILWASLWILSFIYTYLSLANTTDHRIRHISLSLLFVLVAAFIFSSTSNVLLNQLLWFIFALSASIYKLASENRDEYKQEYPK